MKDGIQNLLIELRTGLRQLYASRLKGVYLCGSYARGDQDGESDVDVLVVLDRVDHYCAEIDRSGYLASELSLKYGVSVSRVFLSAVDWANGETPFLTNVRAEAIAA